MRNIGKIAPMLAGAVVVVFFGLQAHPAEDEHKKNTLLLRDFQPQSMLHAPVHNVLRAKFPVIDVHNHVNDARSAGREHIPPAEVLKVMDRCNIQSIVILTGQWGEALQKVVDEMVNPYPGRFVVFTQLSWENIDSPDFSEQMVKRIDDAVARGARGLKITKELGLRVKFKDGSFLTVDDPKLDPIWAECGRLGIPVAIHVTDPEAFFHPLDGANERYEELIDNPGWLFYGPQFPSKKSIMDARNRMFAKHPNTTFIALHVGNWPEDLDYVSDILNRYPNVVVELGARQAELGRQPRRAVQLFLEYQDRILFGTDMTPTEDLYRNYFRWLETADEYFDYYSAPEQGRWKIYGMELPEGVLEKVYHLNAERILRLFKGTAAKGGGGQ